MGNESMEERKSLFGRTRVPFVLVLIALVSFALYYVLFYERKTAYYSDRNARVVSGLSEQLRGAIDATSDFVRQAADVPTTLAGGIRFTDDRRAKLPAPLSDPVKCGAPSDDPRAILKRPHQYSESSPRGWILHFHHFVEKRPPVTHGVSIKSTLGEGEDCRASDALVSGSVELKPLVDQIFRQSTAAVFDGVFLLDASGRVIYQYRDAPDDSGPGVRIVRLTEMSERNFIGKNRAVSVGDLLATSRQTPVRLGDADYELFSAPLRSGVPLEVGGSAKDGDDTWVLCGLVRASEFRSRSLAISVTLVSALTAIVLLLVLSWPFLKVTLINRNHRVSTMDVILLGMCAILASSILTLTMLDWLTYSALEDGADGQLGKLAETMEQNFETERQRISQQLDEALRFATAKVVAGKASDRNGDLLPEHSLSYPWIQSFTFVRGDGMQGAKWMVDSRVAPVVNVASRTYFSAAKNKSRDYLDLAGGRMAIQSVRSMTTGLPEIDFGRRTDEKDTSAEHADLYKQFPVLTMIVPDVLSIGRPILPAHQQFAIIDAGGQVLFHSESQRNTIENFFAETDRDRALRSAVNARRQEWMNIRYWGEDYRAFVQPMTALPWTIITFREKRGLRTLNTEALIITLIFLLVLAGPGLLLPISLILVLRPRYSARWLWPDPVKVPDYAGLAGLYAAIIGSAVALVALLRGGSLIILPYWLVPFTLLVTYLRIAKPKPGLKRNFVASAAAFCLVIAVVSVSVGKTESFTSAIVARVFAFGAIAIPAAVLGYALTAKRHANGPTRGGERVKEQATLPLLYCGVAFLLLVIASVIPTTAFFKAAYQVQMTNFVKSVQMKFARDLQTRWWRIAAEYSEERGRNKQLLREQRWNTPLDLYDDAFSTKIVLGKDGPPALQDADDSAFPEFIERVLPHYSEMSVQTRELIHDRSSDHRWWWTFRDPAHVTMSLRPEGSPRFFIESAIPTVFMGFRGVSSTTVVDILLFVLVTIVIIMVDYWIARFIARRVFLVDLVNPRWFAGGVLGMRQVICYPCDPDRERKLFDGYASIDISDAADRKRASTLPKAFTAQPFERYVLIRGVDYRCASGERGVILRGLLERLIRNSDRTVVIRPASMSIITSAFLQGTDGELWSKLLANFVWVSGDQLDPENPDLTVSGQGEVFRDDSPFSYTGSHRGEPRWRKILRSLGNALGFGPYVDQITDQRRSALKAIHEETENDPYLRSLASGLDAEAGARDQALEEISERAETYYTGLWHTCSPTEKIVLLQLAETGLVNDKMRKDVRRLLARGLIRRDPRPRIMNETFRRFVIAQSTINAHLANELDPNFVTDAWQRFRVPFFAAVGVVTLFFVATQHELFDATVAMVTGLTASLPTFAKILTAFGDRATRNLR